MMKVTIQQVNAFSVTIGDKTYNDFQRCDEWEGMIKFSGPSGSIIVDNTQNSFISIFSCLFSDAEPSEKVKFRMIKCSDGLAQHEP